MQFQWKGVVASLAPTIAGILEGPLYGLGISTLSVALLKRADGQEDEVVEALRTLTPEVVEAVRQAEVQLQERVQALGVDLASLQNSSARGPGEVAGLEQTQSSSEKTPRLLAIVVLAGFFVSVAYVFLGSIQPEVAGVAGTLIGYVSAKADTVVAYYFGSSAGSAEKNQMIRLALGKEPVQSGQTSAKV